MSKNNVIAFAGRDEHQDLLTEMLRAGAQQLIEQAVGAELQCLLAQQADRRNRPVPPGLFAMAIYLSVIYKLHSIVPVKFINPNKYTHVYHKCVSTD